MAASLAKNVIKQMNLFFKFLKVLADNRLASREELLDKIQELKESEREKRRRKKKKLDNEHDPKDWTY